MRPDVNHGTNLCRGVDYCARMDALRVLLRWKKERQHSGHSYSRIWHTDEDFLRQRAGAACGVRLGARSVLMGGNQIGRDCQISDDVCLHPNVVIYANSQIGHRVTIHAGTVIGSDGYGYVLDEGRHRKMLQVGSVIIHDDVEIGANAAIDCGALGSTVIGQGTKIDNLVHIAHNVAVGRNCIIMGQVGFAGSTHLGDYCVVASQSGIAGHLKHPPPDGDGSTNRPRSAESSSTSRYDSEKRRYQPTARRITSGSNCRHLKRLETEGARSIGPA